MNTDSLLCNQSRDIFMLCNYYLDGKCYFDRDSSGELPCEEYMDNMIDIYRETARDRRR